MAAVSLHSCTACMQDGDLKIVSSIIRLELMSLPIICDQLASFSWGYQSKEFFWRQVCTFSYITTDATVITICKISAV